MKLQSRLFLKNLLFRMSRLTKLQHKNRYALIEKALYEKQFGTSLDTVISMW